MEKELKNLDQFEGENPFKVPDGYMEGLASQIMSQLPEKTIEEPKRASLMERVRPWLYMAAIFAGLGLFFNLLVGNGGGDKTTGTDSLFVQNMSSLPTTIVAVQDEDADYLEYLESRYESYILEEEWGYYE